MTHLEFVLEIQRLSRLYHSRSVSPDNAKWHQRIATQQGQVIKNRNQNRKIYETVKETKRTRTRH